MRLLAKFARWAMRSRISVTRRDEMPDSRSGASRKELLAKFSQRSRQRDQAIEDFVAQHGRKPTDNEVAVLVRESRADKLIEISTRELRRNSGLG